MRVFHEIDGAKIIRRIDDTRALVSVSARVFEYTDERVYYPGYPDAYSFKAQEKPSIAFRAEYLCDPAKDRAYVHNFALDCSTLKDERVFGYLLNSVQEEIEQFARHGYVPMHVVENEPDAYPADFLHSSDVDF